MNSSCTDDDVSSRKKIFVLHRTADAIVRYDVACTMKCCFEFMNDACLLVIRCGMCRVPGEVPRPVLIGSTDLLLECWSCVGACIPSDASLHILTSSDFIWLDFEMRFQQLH